MLIKNYELNLELPVVPGLPQGPEYEEFRVIYNALRQLQDGLAENAGLVTYDFSGETSVDPFLLYTVAGQTNLIFEASTAITVGKPVVFDAANPGKVKAPPASGGLLDGNILGMPLFSCNAGQKVAVAITGGIAPLPGAVLGTAYKVADNYSPVGFTPNPNLLTYEMRLGVCLKPNTLLVTMGLAG